MQRHPRGAHDVLVASQWQPGRLLIGWSLGVLTTLGLLTATGGWYEYRQLSTTPASGSPARRLTGQESACQVDKDGAVNVGGYEVVPDQPDGCYLRRPRIRPWQWADGVREQIGRLSTTARGERRAIETAGARLLHEDVTDGARLLTASEVVRTLQAGAEATRSPSTAYDVSARWYDARVYGMS
jgi:hypothetical protein